MRWKNLTIGKKIIIGFGFVLFMLTIVGFISYSGTSRITRNAKQVIDGNKLDGLLAQKEIDHLKWASKVTTLIVDDHTNSLDVEIDVHKCALGKWLYGEGRKQAESLVPSLAPLLDKIEIPHSTLHQSAGQIVKHKLSDNNQAKAIYKNTTLPALMAVRTILENIRAESKKHIMAEEAMLAAVRKTKSGVSFVALTAIAIGILLAFIITRGINKALLKVSEQLGDGAEQVASASEEVSQASQLLAEGSSEQAASFEKTSSSLEEMSSMTNQNAEHAKQADNLMKAANAVVTQANQSMDALTGSMQQITKASEETSKIIKTIDEIAFQTNLLALNAAVEAARAGESGAGFAVVADEVRNLAMRAADAAKNTAEMIDGTVKKVNDGSELVDRTNVAFTQVADSASKVGELVAEIAAASREQAQDIEQVNQAVSQMDKVTQQNAASSEESASASEEMSAQAEQVKGIVGELFALVGGNANTVKRPSASEKRLPEPTHMESRTPPKTVKNRQDHKQDKAVPEQIIPFDEDVFKDF